MNHINCRNRFNCYNRINYFSASVLTLLLLLPSMAQAHPLDTLPPGHWMEVPNSKLRSVAYQWPPGVPHGTQDVTAVITAWNGGAYDTKRDRLLIFGGGHNGYAGNEIYAFNVPTLRWERLTDPCLRTDKEARFESTGYYPDANGQPDPRQPRSRHSGTSLQYVPTIDKFCAMGSGAMYPTGASANNTDCFDFAHNQWERKADALAKGPTAYDPVTGHIWIFGGGFYTPFLVEWDPATDVWTRRSKNTHSAFEYRFSTAAIDSKRRKLVAVGEGRVRAYDLTVQGLISVVPWTTTGDTEIVTGFSPGFDYDPVSDKFVAWNGGADVYTLNPDTRVWTKVQPAPTNTVIPTGADVYGTYGRFRYSPRYNVFIVVNSVDQNVYIYRLGGGASLPTPPTPPSTLKVKTP